jgi:hypothetical protein
VSKTRVRRAWKHEFGEPKLPDPPKSLKRPRLYYTPQRALKLS